NPEPVPEEQARPRPVPRPVQPVASSLPGGPSLAGAVGELCGSMVLATVFAALATALWAALAQTRGVAELGAVFFLTVSASWWVRVPTKFWTRPMDDSWARRVVMLMLGGLIGLHALWVEGWTAAGRPGRPVEVSPASLPGPGPVGADERAPGHSLSARGGS